MRDRILERLIARWEKEANQYQTQVEECRAKGISTECQLGHMTALRQCAKELQAIAVSRQNRN